MESYARACRQYLWLHTGLYRSLVDVAYIDGHYADQTTTTSLLRASVNPAKIFSSPDCQIKMSLTAITFSAGCAQEMAQSEEQMRWAD